VQIAEVIGHATATVKHPSLEGWRLLIVQPLDARGEPDDTPVVCIDAVGSGLGDRVIVTNDGGGVRDMIGSHNTPVRWAVIGIAD
jgi:ethanolamine utilization protein EutN